MPLTEVSLLIPIPAQPQTEGCDRNFVQRSTEDPPKPVCLHPVPSLGVLYRHWETQHTSRIHAVTVRLTLFPPTSPHSPYLPLHYLYYNPDFCTAAGQVIMSLG